MPTLSASKPKPKGYALTQPTASSAADFEGFFDPGDGGPKSSAEIADAAHPPSEASPPAPIAGKQHGAVALRAIVERCRLQTRAPFDPQHDAEDAALVESLKRRGQVTPVILEQIAGRTPAAYRIKDGHRRIDALRQIGAERVEALIVQAGTPAADLITLTANVRKNFGPMEWARAVERLLHEGHALADLARQTGLVPQRLSEWKQLLDLDGEVQTALEQGRLSLQVALALGKAPLAYQPELARLAEQNDLTETKARQLAERVAERLLAEGPVGVDVAQLAAALGLTPVADGSPAARRRKKGRAPARPVSEATALQLLHAHFPTLEPHPLAQQAAVQGLDEKVLLLAGLYVQEGQLEPAAAVARAATLPLTPDIRAQLGTLEAIAREYDRLERGRWDEQVERLLQVQWLVARQVERVRRAAAQALKKKPRSGRATNRDGRAARRNRIKAPASPAA